MLAIAFSLILVSFMAVHSVNAQIYFEDNFDNPNESEKKWVDIYGTWEFKDGEYHQLLNAVNCMSLVSDDYWDDAWNEYTFEVRANKISGAEGFLIMFRCMGQMQLRGVALREHPPRMADAPVSLQYWWNIGGWANVRSQVESWGGKPGANSNHTIETDEWYDIKIVNTPTDYTVILNGEEVGKVDDSTQEGHGRIGLATWSTLARYDDVIVYGPEGPRAVSPQAKLATAWGNLKK